MSTARCFRPVVLFEGVHPGVPVPQSRPVSVKGRRVHDARSSDHRASLVKAFGFSTNRPRTPLEGPLRVTIGVSGANESGDLDNHAKQVLDALVTARIIAGDSIRVVAELQVRAARGEPMTWVVIEQKEEIDAQRC